MLKARLLVAAGIAALLVAEPRQTSKSPLADASSFAAQVAALSEPGGYFDTDNLISNERSYLQVMPELRKAGLHGGAYVGVGPDQNFSYIAAVRPAIAFIIDIRRDNLLLHLLFKALFQLAGTRVEYVALLVGRQPPARLDGWQQASIERIVGYIDGAKRDPGRDAARARLKKVIAEFGVPLSADDLATIGRFHDRFIESSLDLRFNSTGRAPQSHYPSYRELLLERDPEGVAANYLASEEAFHVVKTLQTRDLVIPVTGNLSGPSALAAIGGTMRRRGDQLAAFYASNVEFYLFGDGTFRDFAANLRRVPHSNRSLIIRSVFGRYSAIGGGSSSHTQPISLLLDAFQNGRIRSYRDLIE